ncbi:acyltransferase family protein [Blastococcus atacamensis]|uniref:acyltransferase family protein n=1 Tax=Blastococcus atacamensis TaxID=2070508 RepID=UPI000CEBC7F0|nr:acyltransferase family protein [Blastococcus atacamensis]
MTTTAERVGPETTAPHEDAVVRQPNRHRFRTDIEGLRAVAVGLVVLDHVVGWPSGGFVGVDVFFVISGFLITGLLVRERERTGRISIRAFYVRRARRLLPAAVATLVVSTLAAWLLFIGGRFWDTVVDALWALVFAANINFARQGTDYFEQTAAPSPVQHFWSLAVEEQFYLVWPALILLAFAVPAGRGLLRRTRVRLGLAVSAATLASFLWSVHATAESPATAYFSTFTRAWELGLGALVAVSAGALGRVPARLRAALAWAGLAGVLASAFVVSSTDPFPGSLAALPVVSAALVVAFGAASGGPATRWALGSAPARFLGRISYSLYLWHWPVVVVCWSVLVPSAVSTWLVAVGLSLAIATLSYHSVEQPVLHSRWLVGGRRAQVDPRARPVFQRARGVASVALAAVVLIGGALTVAFPPGKLDPQAVAAADAALAAAGGAEATAADADPLTRELTMAATQLAWPEDLRPGLDELSGYLQQQWSDGCFDVGEWNVAQCRFGAPDASHHAVLLGDSIAGAWLPGLRAEMEPAGWSLQTLTMGQCPNITAMTVYQNRPFVECAEHRQWALGHIAATKPELVILSDTYDTELADPGADKPAIWAEGLRSVVEQIQASGARVVILTAPPSGANLQTCASAVNGPADCIQGPPQRFLTQVSVADQVAAATGATHVNPERWFCVEELCPAVVGSTPVFADGLHMTAEYARKIGRAVVDAVLSTSAGS